MARKSILWRLYPIYLIIIVASLAAAAWYASTTLKDFYYKQTERDLESRAHLLARQVLPLPPPDEIEALNRACVELGKKSQTRITLIVPNGTVICDSEEEPARMENHANRPEIQEAMAGGTGVFVRYSHTLDQDMMYVAIPLWQEETIIGVMRTSIPVTAVNSALQTIYIEILLGGTAIVLFAILLGWALSRRISRPLLELKKGADRFARGDLAYRVDVHDSLEFGSVAEAMNQMAGRLDERIRTVIHQRNEQEAVLASMVEGVLAVDGEERLINMNRAAAEMIGVDVSQVEGRTIQETIRNTDLQQFVSRTLASRSPVEGELVLGENQDRYVQIHGTVLMGADGTSIGALVVLNDMTRLIKLENIRRDFVANVSHELKTPITSIKGFVETLLMGTTEQEEAERFLQIVLKHANRLNSIINDLLSLSKIEQGTERNEIVLQKGAVREVMQSAIQLCQEKGKAKGITIELDCDNDLKARINARLLEQAVVNLLDNAVKYSDPDSGILVAGDREGDGVAISVTDQGCGIAEEHHPRLFERFYRVDKARSRELGGTGLGLAIVKHIAQSHGGRVGVKSLIDKGSTFTIFLPS
ncbi:MAG: HAMP domain-containing sensor histidine kinase [Planctomycetota bacterium]|jgi:two-component system phosphate regulon sensor histidine kinase PhoR